MKLFQRIFATFCAVIICAIFVASFSFWLVQNTLAENQFNQRRTIETTLMGSMVSAFRSRGDSGAREILNEWKDNPVSDAVFVILDDDNKDILDRDIDEQTIPVRCLSPACRLLRFGTNSLSCRSSSSSAC